MILTPEDSELQPVCDGGQSLQRVTGTGVPHHQPPPPGLPQKNLQANEEADSGKTDASRGTSERRNHRQERGGGREEQCEAEKERTQDPSWAEQL